MKIELELTELEIDVLCSFITVGMTVYLSQSRDPKAIQYFKDASLVTVHYQNKLTKEERVALDKKLEAVYQHSNIMKGKT